VREGAKEAKNVGIQEGRINIGNFAMLRRRALLCNISLYRSCVSCVCQFAPPARCRKLREAQAGAVKGA
jgi:hypothetical protein